MKIDLLEFMIGTLFIVVGFLSLVGIVVLLVGIDNSNEVDKRTGFAIIKWSLLFCCVIIFMAILLKWIQ